MSIQTRNIPRESLSHSMRARYKREIANARSEMNGGLVVPSARGKDGEAVVMPRRRLEYLAQFDRADVRPDSGILSNRIRRMEKALAGSGTNPLSPDAKMSLEKEASTLRSWLSSKMVPKSHSGIGYSHPDFQKAVKQGVNECLPDFQAKAGRYKSIMREIAPNDPDAANLERIRQ